MRGMSDDTKREKTLFERALFVSICPDHTSHKQPVPLIPMNHVQRTLARLVLVRSYGTHSLQQRISELFNFVRRSDTSCDPSWHSVTALPTLDSAVAKLESIARPSTSLEHSALSPSHPPPTWLLVRLCDKVKSQADAEKTSHLIITYLPHIPSNLRPPVLILVVHLLSTYRVLPALDRVMKLFIGLPIFYEFWHFNRLLRALSLYTNSPTDARYMGRLAILLIKTMAERELTITKETYELLLQNRYITMELAEELRQRMIRDKIVPNRALLEALLRISARRGPVHRATPYARAIHRLDRQVTPSESETNQTGSTTVEYLTHLIHENSKRKQFDTDAEWLRFTRAERSHRFLNNQKNTSAAAWAARLFSLSRTRSFSPESLVMFFNWSHAQCFPFRTHTTLTYTIVLLGLLRKRAYSLALEIWERYRSHGKARKLCIDAIALAVGVEVMVRAGHPDRALALMDSPVHERTRARRIPRPLSNTTNRQTVSISLVNRFMRVLSLTNPSAALRLWEHMGILYAATPNALSFTAMLNAARYATLNGDSFAGAVQELGLDLRLRLPFSKLDKTMVVESRTEMESTTVSPETLDRARRRNYKMLEKLLVVNEGDMWGGERAWRRAYRIFTSALLAGWPTLAGVRAPAHAIRSSGESPATAPFRDLKSFLTSPPPPPPQPNATMPINGYNDSNHPEDDFSLHDDPNPPLLPTHPHGAYPSFSPDDSTFRAALLLVGMARCASQIPQILGWMRALDIKPRVFTLAYALVFWAEVSIGAPLLEKLRIRGWHEDGEYVRLVRWIGEWVGVDNVPDEATIGDAMRNVDAMRRGIRRIRH